MPVSLDFRYDRESHEESPTLRHAVSLRETQALLYFEEKDDESVILGPSI